MDLRLNCCSFTKYLTITKVRNPEIEKQSFPNSRDSHSLVVVRVELDKCLIELIINSSILIKDMITEKEITVNFYRKWTFEGTVIRKLNWIHHKTFAAVPIKWLSNLNHWVYVSFCKVSLYWFISISVAFSTTNTDKGTRARVKGKRARNFRRSEIFDLFLSVWTNLTLKNNPDQ